MFNVIEPNPSGWDSWTPCRACGKSDLSRQEFEHRVHEYCRSKLGPNWRLDKVAS